MSVDGTWQRGVFSSLNGVVVAVSTTNFKAVDVEIVSRYCQPWTSKEELTKTDKIAFNKWKIDHEASCKANYKGSAGSMEAAGATKIFQRLIEKHGVCYISYYGDADDKSYEEVKNVYPGITVEKYECMGHYQKRLQK